MKAFVAVCALIAVASAVPNSGYGGGSSYGGGYGGQTIRMHESGHPSVRNVGNNGWGSSSVTYTAPGQSYQASPVTYAAPMLTFNPPQVNYNGQSVTYATSGSDGHGAQSYQPSSSYSAPSYPQVQNYQASYNSGYNSGSSNYGSSSY